MKDYFSAHDSLTRKYFFKQVRPLLSLLKEPQGVIPDYEIKINNVNDLFERFGNNYLLNKAIKYLSD